MSVEEIKKIQDFAAAQWSLILICDRLDNRPADRDACIRDLADAE